MIIIAGVMSVSPCFVCHSLKPILQELMIVLHWSHGLVKSIRRGPPQWKLQIYVLINSSCTSSNALHAAARGQRVSSRRRNETNLEVSLVPGATGWHWVGSIHFFFTQPPREERPTRTKQFCPHHKGAPPPHPWKG